jgi:hypothetical protein
VASVAAAGGRPRRNMHFLSPKKPMLNSPNSACDARIKPNYAQLCRLISQRRRRYAESNAGIFRLALAGGDHGKAAPVDPRLTLG